MLSPESLCRGWRQARASSLTAPCAPGIYQPTHPPDPSSLPVTGWWLLMHCDCCHVLTPGPGSRRRLLLGVVDTASSFSFGREVACALPKWIPGLKRLAKARNSERLPLTLSKSCVYLSLAFAVSVTILRIASASAAHFPIWILMLRMSRIVVYLWRITFSYCVYLSTHDAHYDSADRLRCMNGTVTRGKGSKKWEKLFLTWFMDSPKGQPKSHSRTIMPLNCLWNATSDRMLHS